VFFFQSIFFSSYFLTQKMSLSKIDANSSNKRKRDDYVYVGTVVKCVNKHIPYISGVINILALHLEEGNLASLIACYISCNHVPGKYEPPCSKAPIAVCPKMDMLACQDHCDREMIGISGEHTCDLCTALCGSRLHDPRMYYDAQRFLNDLLLCSSFDPNLSCFHMGRIILEYACFSPFEITGSTAYHRERHGDGPVIMICRICALPVCEICSRPYSDIDLVVRTACHTCVSRNPHIEDKIVD